MSKKFYLLILAALPVILLLSCRKEGHDHNENKAVILNVSVNAGETYQLDLRQYANEDDLATITKQAVSYSISAISKSASGNYLYQFSKAGSPKTGGNGTEQVALKLYEPEGRCRSHDETNITINFTIL